MTALGGTGNFPDGKISPDDEGELTIGVASKDGLVHINFGKNVAWLAMPAENAIGFARLLLQHAGATRVEVEYGD